MLLAMKTLNVIYAFLSSFCQIYNCRLFLSQIVGWPFILSVLPTWVRLYVTVNADFDSVAFVLS